MDIQFDSDLPNQLELLREKVKQKEMEIAQILLKQKDEYQKNIKEKDEEVTNFVDSLIKENLGLKKMIVSLEIDLENYKEKYQAIVSTNQLQDNLYYDNIKQIKEQTEAKQKEILDKYENLTKAFMKEQKALLSGIRKTIFENKQKIYTNEENLNYLSDDIGINSLKNNNDPFMGNSSIPIEEHFNVLDNKIRLLYEELKNKEKYSLVIEQKYEMTTEENKMIKRKLQEEKYNMLNMIEEVQKQNSLAQEELMKTIKSEIYDKKNNLEKEVKKHLDDGQNTINDLLKERSQLKEEIKDINEKLEKSNEEFDKCVEKVVQLQANLEEKENEANYFGEFKLQLEKKIKELTLDKEILKKSLDDLTLKLNDSVFKIISLESTVKITIESSNREIEKTETRTKMTIENFDKENLTLNSQIKELKNKLEEEKQISNLLAKRDIELNESLFIIENLKSEISQKDLNMKFIQNSQDDLKLLFEKLQNKHNKLEEEIIIKNSEVKKMKEKIAESEIEVSSTKKELARISSAKEDLFSKFEEGRKNNVFVNTQLETLKMTSNIELQRLKNHNAELEKMNEKNLKINAVENYNNELKKEISNLKYAVSKVYKVYLNIISNYNSNNSNNFKSNQSQNQNQNELKMLDDMELGYDKLFDLITLTHKKETSSVASVDSKVIKKYEEEITNLKKKLNTVMQITNSVTNNKSLNHSPSVESNINFKAAEKENSNSLYESILIHLKNTNIKHLLEIFQLNIQREEQIRTLLSDPKDSTISASLKKQISDLDNNFLSLKNLCEAVFQEYQQRSKLYIQPEEFEKRLEDNKIFTQNLLDMVLDTLMSFKIDDSESVIFRMPIDDYNHFIENISVNLENFNHKVNLEIEAYNKYGSNVEKAIDTFIKSTAVDFDVLNNLMGEKFI